MRNVQWNAMNERKRLGANRESAAFALAAWLTGARGLRLAVGFTTRQRRCSSEHLRVIRSSDSSRQMSPFHWAQYFALVGLPADLFN